MRTITYNKTNQEFTVKFEYNAWLIGNIKKHFNVKRYDSASKSWIIPAKNDSGTLQAGTLYNYANRDNFTADAETETALEAAYFGRKEFFETV